MWRKSMWIECLLYIRFGVDLNQFSYYRFTLLSFWLLIKAQNKCLNSLLPILMSTWNILESKQRKMIYFHLSAKLKYVCRFWYIWDCKRQSSKSTLDFYRFWMVDSTLTWLDFIQNFVDFELWTLENKFFKLQIPIRHI